MSARTVFLILVALLAYNIVVMWWREARANARLLPMGLATAQGLLVASWLARSHVIGQPKGPLPATLMAMFLYANLPPSLVQTTLAARRPGSRIKIPYFAWMTIGFFGLLTLGQAGDALITPNALETVPLVIQVCTVVSLGLLQAGIIGPGVRGAKAGP